MAREYRVIAALGPSEVPVAEAVALCTDPAILGEPFYLMSFVDGVVLETPAAVPNRASANRASELLVDTLLALHRVDPAAVGLADFGRPDGFCERQIRRWHAQFLASLPGLESEAGAVDVAATELGVVQALGQRLPVSGPIGIVHGDYRLTNVMFRSDLQHIAAVVDWEMATVGDPLTDVGLLFVYHELAGATGAVMPAFPADRGFLTPSELVARYAEGSGHEVPALDWYIAFGYFKLGVIAAGIHARFRQGRTVGPGFEQFGSVIDLALRGAQHRLGGM
jgi:aminoglycoside phosphotransferase (APT) family kinase protein